MTRANRLLLVVGLPLVAAAAAGFLLTGLFGPSDDGLSCERAASGDECSIRQTRFFGLAGNSSFAIPQTEILGATARCMTRPGGGRGGPNCVVSLRLNSGPHRDYPVLSYALLAPASASAAKLNAYFGDPGSASVDIREDVLSPFVLFLFVPIGVGFALAVLRWWVLHKRAG